VLTTRKVAARRITKPADFRFRPDEKSSEMDDTYKSRTSVEDFRTLADEVSSAGVFRVYQVWSTSERS
jgi:hypothetical protein